MKLLHLLISLKPINIGIMQIFRKYSYECGYDLNLHSTKQYTEVFPLPVAIAAACSDAAL